MKTHGMTINTDAIARGIYEMMPDDDKACMVVGMLPKEWMDMAENQVRHVLAERQVTPGADAETIKYWASRVKKEVVNAIMTGIAASLLKVATQEGVCKV